MDPSFDFYDKGNTTRLYPMEITPTDRKDGASPSLSPPRPSSLLTKMINRPQYSVQLAYTLSVASKLSYEDVDVIKYELAQAGFDVKQTFCPFAYKVIYPWIPFENPTTNTFPIVQEHLCLCRRKRRYDLFDFPRVGIKKTTTTCVNFGWLTLTWLSFAIGQTRWTYKTAWRTLTSECEASMPHGDIWVKFIRGILMHWEIQPWGMGKHLPRPHNWKKKAPSKRQRSVAWGIGGINWPIRRTKGSLPLALPPKVMKNQACMSKWRIIFWVCYRRTNSSKRWFISPGIPLGLPLELVRGEEESGKRDTVILIDFPE